MSKGAGRRRRARGASARARSRSWAGEGRTPSGPARARIRPTSAAGKASGSRSWRMAMYCAVHSPIAGQAFELRDRLVQVALRAEDLRVVAHGAGQAVRAAPARPRHAERGDVGRARRSGVGNTRVSPAIAAAIGEQRSPQASTSRPASGAPRRR